MFTGIVQGLAKVSHMERRTRFMSIRVGFPENALRDVATGASVAINGVCLTVTEFGQDWASFDVIDETLDKTTLGGLSEGSRVNFERAATFGSEIGGHLLSGHISDTAKIIARESTDSNCSLSLQVTSEWIPYILAKGFVAVDGISLTVGAVNGPEGIFNVHLIPETLNRTTLGFRQVGDALNLEIDSMTQAVVDTVRRVMAEKE